MTSYYDTLASFHEDPVLLPGSIVSDSFQFIVCAVAVVSSLHLTFYTVLLQRSVTSINKKPADDETAETLIKRNVMKASYQATNFCVNVFLGSYGMYHMLTQPYPTPSPTIAQRLLIPPFLSNIPLQFQILDNHQFGIFGVFQIAYNLWAVPVGYFCIGESPLMLAHHFAAIYTGFMVSNFSHGFRYHAPMLYGCMELSSVPLAIVNYLQDHKEWTKRHLSTTFNLMKVLFAVMFLWLRCLLSSTHMYHIVRNSLLLWYSSYKYSDPGIDTSVSNGGGTSHYLYSYWDGAFYRLIMGGFGLCGVLLAFLQYYWGFLIIKKLNRMVPREKKQKDQ